LSVLGTDPRGRGEGSQHSSLTSRSPTSAFARSYQVGSQITYKCTHEVPSTTHFQVGKNALKMPSTAPTSSFKALNVAVIGAGLGGLCAALSLRRTGLHVTLYERNDFSGEMGAGLGVAPNGSRWLTKWGVDIEAAKPNVIGQMTVHHWTTGDIKMVAPTGTYREKFGYVRF
jgi:hypothetical protein